MNLEDRVLALESALRKLRDAAAISQQNADQVGIGPEYAEATRLLDGPANAVSTYPKVDRRGPGGGRRTNDGP